MFMERRKLVNKKRYVLAFMIGTAIFLFGFAITYFFAFLEYQRTITQQDYISYKIFQDKLKYDLYGEDICNSTALVEITEDLRFQMSIMGVLERKFGKDNVDVKFRKKFYVLTQLTHFDFVKTINEKCEDQYNIVFFFYSNDKEHEKKVEHLSSMVGVLYERNKENTVLYSVDIDLDSEIVDILKEKYRVNGPMILINEKVKFDKIDNIDDIEIYLK
jgi:hypothetical protein